MTQLIEHVPADGLSALGIPMIKPHTPLCPNCARPMVLSHKFYAQAGGPQLRHFHCTFCKVGLTEAEEEQD